MAENRKAGWYHDPKGAGERWWNGIGWSETVRRAGGAIGHSPTGVEAPRSRIGRRIPVLDPQHPAAPIVYSPSNPAPQVPGTSFARRTVAGYTIDAPANRMAFASITAAILGMFLSVIIIPSLLAIVFALVGLARSRRSAANSQGSSAPTTMLWVGLVLGGVGLALGIGQLVLFFATLASMVPPGLIS